MSKNIVIVIIGTILVALAVVLIIVVGGDKKTHNTKQAAHDVKLPISKSISGRSSNNDSQTIFDVTGDVVTSTKLGLSDIEIGSAIQLSSSPVSGAGFHGDRVRYVDKKTGFVYEVGKTGLDRVQITDTSILRTFESAWSPSGEKVVLRYMDENGNVNTFAGSVPEPQSDEASTTAPLPLVGSFLQGNIDAVAASPMRDKVFYMQKTGDTHEGIVSDMDGTNKTLIYSSGFGDFNIDWVGERLVSLVTKPTNGVPGFAYAINTRSRSIIKLIGGINGITASVSPNGDYILYSESKDGSTKTYIKNTNTGEVFPLSLKTFGDKCVWDKDEGKSVYCGVPSLLDSNNLFPDSWYQGYSLFQDALWRIDAETMSQSLINKSTRADITNPVINKGGTYIIYTNKRDQTLWGVRVH